MRIEFRGKDSQTGEWRYGWFVGYSEHSGYIYGDYVDKEEVWHVLTNTVGQYTGLKDKNGKKIFEGDVVSLEGWMPKEMQICFIEGAFCLANKKGEYVSDIHYIQHAGIKCAEIVGNIYDNPELLEVSL